MTPCLSRFVHQFLALSCLIVVLCLSSGSARAACPPGPSNPITRGGTKGKPAVIFSNLGGGPVASFSVLGALSRANSGSLRPPLWLVNLGDLDGDGLPEYRVEAPGEGLGGWGDPATVGCPSSLNPSRPPLVLRIEHESEDLDG